jgi:hypothetical protein
VSALARGMIAQRRAIRRTVRCISQGYWFESSRRSFYQGFMPWAALFDHQLPLLLPQLLSAPTTGRSSGRVSGRPPKRSSSQCRGDGRMVSDWLRPCEIVGRPQLVLLGSQGGPPTAPGSSRVTLALQPVEHVGGRPSQVAADLVRPGCFAGGAPLVDRGDRNGQVGRQVLIVQSGLDMRAPVSTGPGSGLAGRLTAPSPGRLLGLGATRAGRGRGVRGSPARSPACVGPHRRR